MKLKYQQGGTFVPPFAVMQPFILPTEQPTKASSTTKKSKEEDDTGMDVKDIIALFKDMKGLDGDVIAASSMMTSLFNSIDRKMNSPQAKMFGGTSSIASDYIKILNLSNQMQNQRELYERAEKTAVDKGSIHEAVINSRGLVMVTDGEGFDWVTPEEYAQNIKDYNIVTNQELLNYRFKGIGGLAFNSDVLLTISNSVGINEVTDYIQNTLKDLGTNTTENSGYAGMKKGELMQGLKDYAMAISKSGMYNSSIQDLYKADIITKTQAEQANLALQYIYTSMSDTAKSLLKLKSDGTTAGAVKYVLGLISSKLSYENTFDPQLIGGPTKSSSDSTKDSSDKSNPYLQLIREEGGQSREFTLIPDGTNRGLYVTGTFYSALPNINEEMSIDDMLSTGLLHITNNSRKSISFGDQLLDPSQLKDVMFDNEGGAVMTLPIIKDQLGNIRVNLGIVEDFNKVQEEMKTYKNLSEQEYFKKYAELLKKYELDELIDFTTGLPDLSRTAQFLVVGAYTTDKIDINKNSKFIKKVNNPTEDLQNRLIKGLSTDKDKSDYSVDVDDHWGFLELFWDDVYKANVFIPLNQNPIAAINAQGDQRSENSVSQSELMYQNFNKLKNMKPTYEIE